MSETIDLFGASAEIYIASRGTTRSLASIINSSSKDSGWKIAQHMNFIEKVSVKIALFDIITVDVTIAPPLDVALALLRSKSLGMGFNLDVKKYQEKEGIDIMDTAEGAASAFQINHMIVRLHYGGRSSPYYKTIMTVPEIDVSADGITIGLKGSGILFQSANRFTKTSEKDKRKDALDKKLASDFDIDWPSQANDPKGWERLQSLDAINAVGSDMEVIQDLVKKSECIMVCTGCDHFDAKATNDLAKQKILIRSREYAKKKGIGAYKNVAGGPTFVAFRQIDPNKAVFPLLSMNVPIANLFMPGAALGAYGLQYNSDTKKVEKVQIGAKTAAQASNVQTSADGSMAGNTEKEGDLTEGGGPALHIPKDPITGALDKIKGLYHSFFERAFTYNITSIGVFDLLPGQNVNIKFGDVAILSGQYDLYEIEHSLSSSGAESSMVCYRTGGLAGVLSSGAEVVKEKAVGAKNVLTKGKVEKESKNGSAS